MSLCSPRPLSASTVKHATHTYRRPELRMNDPTRDQNYFSLERVNISLNVYFLIEDLPEKKILHQTESGYAAATSNVHLLENLPPQCKFDAKCALPIFIGVPCTNKYYGTCEIHIWVKSWRSELNLRSCCSKMCAYLFCLLYSRKIFELTCMKGVHTYNMKFGLGSAK